jgi:DNA-binding transcriptional regulator GbsR (MarR family)
MKLNICIWSGVVAMVKLNKSDELVVSTLKSAGKPLTLAEIAERTGESKKKVFRVLRKLFENQMIDCENQQYRLAKP